MEDFLMCGKCHKLLRPAFQGEDSREADPLCPACFEEMVRLEREDGDYFDVYRVDGGICYENPCGTFLVCEAVYAEPKPFMTLPLQKTLLLDEAGHAEFCEHWKSLRADYQEEGDFKGVEKLNTFLKASLDDFFIPYETFKQITTLPMIPDDETIETAGCYVTDLNYEGLFNGMTVHELADSYDYAFGVADNASQVLKSVEEAIREGDLCADETYVIFLTPVVKSDEAWSGWRWHKWGEYIGIQHPTKEYLIDEPEIEVVFCFAIKPLK